MKKNKLLRLSDIKLSNKKRKEMNEILSMGKKEGLGSSTQEKKEGFFI